MNEIGIYSTNKPGIQYYKVAGKWSELSASQLSQALSILHAHGKSDRAAIELLSLLLQLDHRLFLRRKLRKKLGAAGLADALELVVWMFSTPEIPYNRFPVLKLSHFLKKSTYLYGPELDKIFQHMTFLEWIKTETYFKQYLFHGNNRSLQEKSLNRLVAAMYRGKVGKVNADTHNGDPRSPYNDYRIDHLESVVAKTPIGVRMAIFHHFNTHRKKWAQAFPHVYGGTAPMVEATQQQAPDDLSLFKAMKNMAGGALHFDTMATVSASAALLDLDDKIYEYNKLKAKSDHGA